MKVHSCVEAHIEDSSSVEINIQQGCYLNTVSIHTEEYPYDVNVIDSLHAWYKINDGTPEIYTSIEANTAVITLEWVCGVGFSERYLCGSDSELITVDGNYLVVKYKPKS